MENSTLIQQIFQDYLSTGGKPQITSFRTHLEKLMKTEIKHLCGSSRRLAPGSHDWRNDLKARFGGRGSKWMQVSLDEVKDTLDRFDAEGIDTEDSRAWTQKAGYAWIRYQKPRLDNGIKVAAFELRTIQSTIDQPHQVHLIPVSELDERIQDLGGTPFSLKLENDAESNDEIQPNMVKRDALLSVLEKPPGSNHLITPKWSDVESNDESDVESNELDLDDLI